MAQDEIAAPSEFTVSQFALSELPRRRFLTQSAALAAGVMGAAPVLAASDVIKIGYLTHRTGPFAPFAEADAFILDNAASQPTSQTVAAGGRAVLSVDVERGTTPLRYQWYMGARGIRSAPVRGVTGPTMTTPPINTPTDFWVEVSNPCGTARSWTATITPVGGSGKLVKRRGRINP